MVKNRYNSKKQGMTAKISLKKSPKKVKSETPKTAKISGTSKRRRNT